MEPLPAPLREPHVGSWRRRGYGTVRWSIFELYEIRYYTADDGGFPAGDYALEAVYRRTMAASTLVDATLGEMMRTDAGCAKNQETRAWLAAALPDVVRGDRLLALVSKGSRLAVYLNSALRAAIDDAALARSFAGIWLGPNTRAPELKRNLLHVCREG